MPRVTDYFSDWDTGETAVGTSAVQVSSTSTPCAGLFIKAKSTNTGIVYIGKSDVTTADGATDTTSGYPLSAGEETPFMIQVSNLNAIYAIASAASQAISYVYLKR
jgi:hypothetical protein